MEHIMNMQKRIGVDVGYHNNNIYPKDCAYRVGKGGIDKSLTLEKIIELAYKMEEKPNIIIKAGPSNWFSLPPT